MSMWALYFFLTPFSLSFVRSIVRSLAWWTHYLHWDHMLNCIIRYGRNKTKAPKRSTCIHSNDISFNVMMKWKTRTDKNTSQILYNENVQSGNWHRWFCFSFISPIFSPSFFFTLVILDLFLILGKGYSKSFLFLYLIEEGWWMNGIEMHSKILCAFAPCSVTYSDSLSILMYAVCSKWQKQTKHYEAHAHINKMLYTKSLADYIFYTAFVLFINLTYPKQILMHRIFAYMQQLWSDVFEGAP